MRLTRALALLAVLGSLVGVAAHVRLVNPSNGQPLRWSDASALPIVLQSAGSDDVTDASDHAALRLALAEWNAAEGAAATLVEDTDPLQQERTDWQADGLHLLHFDEANESGLFGGAGIVALTPVEFWGNGTISDADILFNGQDFTFTTSGGGGFDVQDVAAHELGHLLGFDHSGWAGATMYPFVDPTVTLHRSLSADEVSGMRHVYPAGSFGSIVGEVRRSEDGTAVAGAHVVARDGDGRTAAGALTDPSGGFALVALEPGTYTVYAVPLGDGSGTGSDAPVDASNLSSWHAIETDFAPAVHPAPAVVLSAQTVDLGLLEVGPDVSLNLGTETDRLPLHAQSGATRTVVLRGAGLFPPATLTASDPDLIVGTPMWFGSQVSFQLTVPAGEPPGHVDLAVTNAAGDSSILPAAVEIVPPAPAPTEVDPASGSTAGGSALVIRGSGFRSGARVVIGDRIYEDGQGATSVVSGSEIRLVTDPTVGGLHDVVVIDATGVEGRIQEGFGALDVPVIDSVFPAGGQAPGGTEVTLSGTNFDAAATVWIDGEAQPGVVVESSTLVRFTTGEGAPGPWPVEVVNPDGGAASAPFTFVGEPDPSLSAVSPATAAMGGGELLLVTGADFPADAEVVFGADPDTGLGGVAASSVARIDESTLEVTTPAFPAAGPTSLLVRSAASGQADVLTVALTVSAPPDGGGGGGCHVVPLDGQGRSAPPLSGAAWLLAVLAVLALRARPRQAQRALG